MVINNKKILNLVLIFFFICLFSCQQENNKGIILKEIENISHILDTSKVLKVAVAAMISPKITYEYYNELLAYFTGKIGYRYRFIQRKTYKEVNELLENGEVDIAFICSGAYKIALKTFQPSLICVPSMYGEPYYQAVLITQKNSKFTTIENLKSASIVFTDSLSNSGYMYLNDFLRKKSLNPDSIFSKQLFSGGHDISIVMVQKGLVDLATVDKLILDYLSIEKPQMVSKIKIIHKSPKFGSPPIVASRKLDKFLLKKIQDELLNMHKDSKGKNILTKLHIDKFVLGNDEDYKNIPTYTK